MAMPGPAASDARTDLLTNLYVRALPWPPHLGFVRTWDASSRTGQGPTKSGGTLSNCVAAGYRRCHPSHPGHSLTSCEANMKGFGGLLLLVSLAVAVRAQTPAAGKDYVIRNFRFESGETLPELRLHYVALGTPRRDA